MDFSDTYEPSGNEKKVRRTVALYLLLTNACKPLTWASIREELYLDEEGKPTTEDAKQKKFKREREALESWGLFLIRSKSPTGEWTWSVDKDKSYYSGDELSPDEAIVINRMCQPLVSRPDFPYGTELRFALEKIDSQFNDINKAVEGSPVHKKDVVETLRKCFEQGCCADVSYTNREGVASSYILAPYGFYSCRDFGYMVAVRFFKDNKYLSTKCLTYKLDRFNEAEEYIKQHYAVPEDFDVNSSIDLPFQIDINKTGATEVGISFFVPSALKMEVKASSLEKGSWEEAEGGFIWNVTAKDLDAAASYAISTQIKPMAPAQLVEKWKSILKGAVDHG